MSATFSTPASSRMVAVAVAVAVAEAVAVNVAMPVAMVITLAVAVAVTGSDASFTPTLLNPIHLVLLQL